MRRITLLGLSLALAVAAATTFAPPPSTEAGSHVVFFKAHLDGEQAEIESDAVGAAGVTLNTDSNLLTWDLSWSGFPSDVTAIHFHGPAAPGESAFVSLELGMISGLTSPSVGEATITDEQETELLAGLWYINIHTQDYLDGEIRGQVLVSEVPSTATPRPAVPGDVDCDGQVNSVDASLILQFDAGLLLSLPCHDAADVNQDSTINALDALNVLFFVAGKLDSLPS